MILKYYETKKIDLDLNKIILLYGKNEALKKETINFFLKDGNEILNYEESEVINNPKNFFDTILSKSLFNEKRSIIIKRVTDKIYDIINKIDLNKIEDLVIFLVSDNLEKKSKLRSKFEKDKDLLCVAFYPDNEQNLLNFAYNFIRGLRINLSKATINFIVSRSNYDRETLQNELKKIEAYSKNGKKLDESNINKLINLSENHNMSELINTYLANNKKKIITILNENNFSNDDTILIIRSFLTKLKKLLKLSVEFQKNKNIDLTISTAKPPIFWKDKETTKQQIIKWKPENLKELIYNLMEVELMIKKNFNNSVNLITNFLLDSSRANNKS